MPRFIARFSASAPSYRSLFSAAFITGIAESNFRYTQDQDFCFQLCSRLEERSQHAENQLEQILHQVASLPRLFSASMPNRIFGTHKDQDFCFQPCSRLEERSQDAENQLEQILHQVASLPRLFSASMPNRIFGTHNIQSSVRTNLVSGSDP